MKQARRPEGVIKTAGHLSCNRQRGLPAELAASLLRARTNLRQAAHARHILNGDTRQPGVLDDVPRRDDIAMHAELDPAARLLAQALEGFWIFQVLAMEHLDGDVLAGAVVAAEVHLALRAAPKLANDRI